MKPCIMIHVPKTGGTSIWRSIKDRGFPYQNLGYSIRPKLDPKAAFVNLEHLSVRSLIDRGFIDQEWYDNRFKFSFVRNPWDRLVSLFEYLQYRLRQKRDRESNRYLDDFTSFAAKLTDPGGCEYVKPLGKVATDDWSQANPQMRWVEQGVDFIGRYEQLDLDWKYICHRLEIPYRELPVHRKSNRRFPRYQDYYTSDLVERVAKFYHDDIVAFGYTYD